ncbi:hypothetical protein D3C77_720020 [compost metagenome]
MIKLVLDLVELPLEYTSDQEEPSHFCNTKLTPIVEVLDLAFVSALITILPDPLFAMDAEPLSKVLKLESNTEKGLIIIPEDLA